MDTSGQGDDYRSVSGLSGGEKSFSSACFVTALWDAMDCPLRCMDEYDVFMDSMNRKVTTRLLIELAKNQMHRQFVFLSPLGMDVLKDMNCTHDVKLIGLKDPKTMKGQTTLTGGGTGYA